LLDYGNLATVKELKAIQGGKSPAIIFATSDQRFIIKTITKAEKCILCKDLLMNYLKRITSPKSRLIRIFGVFKLIPTRQYFIIMENVCPFSQNSFLFDLKGSSIGRYVEISNSLDIISGRVLKDENYKLFNKKIYLNKTARLEMIENLEEDMKILRKLNLMDYSLLLCFYEKGHNDDEVNERYVIRVENEIYAIGIIDILQRYDNSKISERAFKKMLFQDGNELSVQPSNHYYRRLKGLIRELFPLDL
jgi:hypothetical protein